MTRTGIDCLTQGAIQVPPTAFAVPLLPSPQQTSLNQRPLACRNLFGVVNRQQMVREEREFHEKNFKEISKYVLCTSKDAEEDRLPVVNPIEDEKKKISEKIRTLNEQEVATATVAATELHTSISEANAIDYTTPVRPTCPPRDSAKKSADRPKPYDRKK